MSTDTMSKEAREIYNLFQIGVPLSHDSWDKRAERIAAWHRGKLTERTKAAADVVRHCFADPKAIDKILALDTPQPQPASPPAEQDDEEESFVESLIFAFYRKNTQIHDFEKIAWRRVAAYVRGLIAQDSVAVSAQYEVKIAKLRNELGGMIENRDGAIANWQAERDSNDKLRAELAKVKDELAFANSDQSHIEKQIRADLAASNKRAEELYETCRQFTNERLVLFDKIADGKRALEIERSINAANVTAHVEIEAMEAELATARRSMEWHAVVDLMPAKGLKIYAAFTDEGHVRQSWVTLPSDTGIMDAPDWATHWCLLPPLPQPAAPPTLAGPFGPECKCWVPMGSGNVFRERGNGLLKEIICANNDATFCEVCGAKRTEVAK